MAIDQLYKVSFLGKKSYPRGLRNNNPGNVKDFGDKWQGRLLSTDGPFLKFETLVWGIRCLIKIIRNKINKNRQNTIRKIVYSYGMENNSAGEVKLAEAYIKSVVLKTQIPEDQTLFADKDTLKKLTVAICEHENGMKSFLSDELLELAYTLSLT